MGKNEIFSYLRTHADRWHEQFDVASLSVFGSFCRDEQQEKSDIDILVKFRHDPTFDNFMNLKYALEDSLGIPVDLVTQAALKPQWREKILKECQHVA